MRFRAVFFDVGETLVHPAPSFPSLFASVLTEQGHERQDEAVVAASAAVRRAFSDAARAGERWTLSPDRSRAFWTGVYGEMLTELGLPAGDGLDQALYERFTDLRSYALFDDVVTTLDALAVTEPAPMLGIVSNFEAWLDELLGTLGIRDRFAVRAISGLDGFEKPDPAIYRLALDRAGLPPEAVAFVGDNPEFDVDPVSAVGMTPVLIDRASRHPGHEGHRIEDLRALPGLLGSL